MSQYTCITCKTCWLDTKFKRTNIVAWTRITCRQKESREA